MLKKDAHIKEKEGRLRCLDDTSLDVIMEAIDCNPHMSDLQLKHKIAQEYIEPHRRRQAFCSGEEADDVQISRRTLKRYFEVFEGMRV